MTLFIRTGTRNKVTASRIQRMISSVIHLCSYSCLHINIVIKTMKKVLEKQESIENDRSKGDGLNYLNKSWVLKYI